MTISLRSPTGADEPVIAELLAAREQADGVFVQHWRLLFLTQWTLSAFDPATDGVAAIDPAGVLVGCAALFGHGGFAAVHPDRPSRAAGGHRTANTRSGGRRDVAARAR